MQRLENARRDAELLGYFLGESARPNRKSRKNRKSLGHRSVRLVILPFCVFLSVCLMCILVSETDQEFALEVILFGEEEMKQNRTWHWMYLILLGGEMMVM